jgi:hypothetical protein
VDQEIDLAALTAAIAAEEASRAEDEAEAES